MQREVHNAKDRLVYWNIGNERESNFLELLKEEKEKVLPQVQEFSAVLAREKEAADKKLIVPIEKELAEIVSMLNPENYVYVQKKEGEKIEGGRRTRGKLRAKSRVKSRKKRRKSRRKSKGRKRRRKKRTKRRR